MVIFKILLNKFTATNGPSLKFQTPEQTAYKSQLVFKIFLQFFIFIPPIAAHGKLNFFLKMNYKGFFIVNTKILNISKLDIRKYQNLNNKNNRNFAGNKVPVLASLALNSLQARIPITCRDAQRDGSLKRKFCC